MKELLLVVAGLIVDSCFLTFMFSWIVEDVFKSSGSPEVMIYSSLDLMTWIDENLSKQS